MSARVSETVAELCHANGDDPSRLMDIARSVQERFGSIDGAAMDTIARSLSIPRVEVESLVTFYAFLSAEPKGKIVIRLCHDVIDEMRGGVEVAAALERELGIRFGETTPDGRISLEYTSCIGMSDQAPAALVNDVVVTNLSPDIAIRGVRALREHMQPGRQVRTYGDGNNSHDLVRAAVSNNLRKAGEVIFGRSEPDAGLRKALSLTPGEVLRVVKASRLRGRGGAGFPTGMKWEFTRQASGKRRYVICNADEGEPGTFKDRVILTERPDLMFEGITIAGYAIGADSGILYLRGEYAYLRAFLEHTLAERRRRGLLGRNVCGKTGFHFDIRIQMGAGAYICGEETALISSCEGTRGDPKNRPPFPAQRGYKGFPTVVNNVETFCCAARIMEMGAAWFASIGTPDSKGTKLLSVSGDCRRPGVYEVPFGITLREVLELCGAEDPLAVQVGGPSGQLVGADDFGRAISFEQLATGGSIMVFGATRNVVEIVAKFLEFFVEESCGYCTPCRVGNALLKERIDRILSGKGEAADLVYLQELAETIKAASRCGLGQTSPNPVLSSLKSFRSHYERLLTKAGDGLQPGFDLQASLVEARRIAGRNGHGTESGR